jgi:DNA polymerase-1
LFWYWNYWTRCLACRVSRDFFLLRRGKDFTYPFREIRLKQKHRWKFMPFRKWKKWENWTEFEIWFKNTVELRHKCRKLFDTMIAHYLINPDMRHNMDILAETYLKYSPNHWRLNWKKREKSKVNAWCRIRGNKGIRYWRCRYNVQLKELFTAELDKTETIKLLTKLRFR